MCLICDYKKDFEALGNRIGTELAEFNAPVEVIQMAATKAAELLREAIITRVAIEDARRAVRHPDMQKILVESYGEERVKEIKEIMDSLDGMTRQEIEVKITEFRDEIAMIMGGPVAPKTVAAGPTVKGFLPPYDPNAN